MSTEDQSKGNVWTIGDRQSRVHTDGANFDKAIESTGYGLFNILLLLGALPVGWTCLIATTTTAFIMNSTECAFELTMFRRGIMTCIVFVGMVLSGPLWDFVLQDYINMTFGKRNVLVLGMLVDALCNILLIHATSFYIFALLKFINGVMIAGPLSVVMSYLSEFHSSQYQPKFSKWAGLLVMVSIIIPPALAATLMLRSQWFHFTFEDFFYPTWRVYLLINAVPSVFGLFTVFLMPQSPKFLMSQSRSREALQLLRAMYSLNNFKSGGSYQISKLSCINSTKNLRTACKDRFKDSVSKIKTLFSKPYLKTILILLFLQFASMIGFHVMRLWVPPLWVILNNFRVFLREYYPPNEYITMCQMIYPRIDMIDRTYCNYTLPHVESAVYVNSTIIATSAVTLCFLFSILVNTRMKKITVMVLLFTLSTIGCFGTNWAVKIPYMLILIAITIVGSRLTSNIVIAYTSEVMPEQLKPTANNVMTFIGNVGGVTGNIVFSIIMEIDCLSAFLSVGCIILVCTLLPFHLIKQDPGKFKPDLERY